MAKKEKNSRVHLSKKHYARGQQPVETMSKFKKAATYPGRYLNTAATIATAGPDRVKQMRKKKPGAYLTEKELADHRAELKRAKEKRRKK